MSQFKDVILLWSSTNSSIPTGWSRETTLDDKFAKAAGDAVAPDQTGGADFHTHTGESHTHAKTDTHTHSVAVQDKNATGDDHGGANTNSFSLENHGHSAGVTNATSGGTATDTIAYPADLATNNRPPYYDFIFIKGELASALVTNIIALFNSSSIPANWLVCTDGGNGAPALGNKYCHGKTTGGDGGTTGGSLTHTHVLDHLHATSHAHTGNTGNSTTNRDAQNDGGTGSNKLGAHTHTISLQSASVNTDTYSATLTSGDIEPVYKKLLAIQKGVGGRVAKGLIGMYLGAVASIPAGWKLCNGGLWEDGVTTTPDMRDKFLKFANATGEIGDTGGANTHVHAASNSHSHTQTTVHTHTTTGVTGSATQTASSNGTDRSPGTHDHSYGSIGNSSANVTWVAGTMSAESKDNQPAYRTLAFIQLTKPLAEGAFLYNLL